MNSVYIIIQVIPGTVMMFHFAQALVNSQIFIIVVCLLTMILRIYKELSCLYWVLKLVSTPLNFKRCCGLTRVKRVVARVFRRS